MIGRRAKKTEETHPKRDKIAFVVVGPPCSANRYLVSLLIKAGCEGKSGHAQPFDGPDYSVKIPPSSGKKIVFHRSFPHGAGGGRVMPSIGTIAAECRAQGHEPVFLVPERAMKPLLLSQLRSGHFSNVTEAKNVNATARYRIDSVLEENEGMTHVRIPYQSLKDVSFRATLAEQLGLKGSLDDPPFEDGDEKYEGRELPPER